MGAYLHTVRWKDPMAMLWLLMVNSTTQHFGTVMPPWRMSTIITTPKWARKLSATKSYWGTLWMDLKSTDTPTNQKNSTSVTGERSKANTDTTFGKSTMMSAFPKSTVTTPMLGVRTGGTYWAVTTAMSPKRSTGRHSNTPFPRDVSKLIRLVLTVRRNTH